MTDHDPFEITPRVQNAAARYSAAAHAMQTGVAYELNANPAKGTPKEARVGINSAHVTHEALAHLFIAKGVFTYEEYVEAIADAMEREVGRYEARANEGRDGGPVISFG